MANKHEGTSKVCCKTCPFIVYSKQDKDGRFWCQYERDYIRPWWVCVNHPEKDKKQKVKFSLSFLCISQFKLLHNKNKYYII